MTDKTIQLRTSYLDSNEALERACTEFAATEVLGFDSEFVRTNTYFPKPGLFQLSDGGQVCLVDPLAIDGWESFRRLLRRESLTWIIHSSSEDLGLLRSCLGVLPARLYDTQRAAAFAGLGYSVSYQSLVKSELGIEVPKEETRSDWLRRPLSETQLDYAALDVEYLVELKHLLTEKMRQRHMLEWFESDCRDLLVNVPDEGDELNWERAYQAISSAWQLDEPALRLLQKLAYWREREARRRNKPKNWIVKDAEILALAGSLPNQGPVDEADIRRSGVFSARFADREAQKISRFLGQELVFNEPANPAGVNRPLGGQARRQLKAFQKLGREQAEKIGISPELLSRRRLWVEVLENIARGRQNIWPAGLDNWRRELLEPGVKAILAANGSN